MQRDTTEAQAWDELADQLEAGDVAGATVARCLGISRQAVHDACARRGYTSSDAGRWNPQAILTVYGGRLLCRALDVEL